MKHIILFLAAAMVLMVVPAWGQSDSLGAYARAARKESHPTATKKFDNDNLPRTDKLSVVGPAAEQPSSDSGDAQPQSGDSQSQDSSAKNGAPPAITPGQSVEEREKAFDQWKGEISEQKSKVDLMSRELDVVQREYRLGAAAFYADAGNRLRNSGVWDKEDAKYKQPIAAKHKARDDAKKGLEDLQEQARKAGVPSSVRQ
ncbi:MAG TPA: hypothetical protein VGF06_17345 [Terriglobales bacterium]